MAKSEISFGVKALIMRHQAAGASIGTEAINECANISNVDPEEAIFYEGDKFTVPGIENIANAVFVSRLGTAKCPAVAVDMADGTAKVLYLSSLRKRVVEYEETPDGFVPRRNASGAKVSHCAGDDPDGKAVYEKIKSLPTAQAIVNEIAGKTFLVKRRMGPYQTSRIGVIKNEYGNESWGVVGLRNTYICVFEML